jgi:hypothetical protein
VTIPAPDSIIRHGGGWHRIANVAEQSFADGTHVFTLETKPLDLRLETADDDPRMWTRVEGAFPVVDPAPARIIATITEPAARPAPRADAAYLEPTFDELLDAAEVSIAEPAERPVAHRRKRGRHRA